jgi:predicted phage-related endonuclease
MGEIYDRTATLGSSDVPKLLGLSRYGDAWDVWAQKRGLIGPTSSNTGDQAAGNMMEEALATEVGRRLGLMFVRGPLLGEPPTIGPEPWMSARVDFRGRVRKGRTWRCGLEIKTVRSFDETWGPDDSDKYPPDKTAQVAWQQAVDDCYKESYLAAWAWSSYELRIYRIRRDKKVEARLVDTCRDWWERHVVQGNMPEVSGSAACGAALGRCWPTPEEKVWRDASPLEQRLATLYRELTVQRSAIDDERRQIGNLLKKAIGPDYGLKTDDGPLVIFHKHGAGRRLRLLSSKDESE